MVLQNDAVNGDKTLLWYVRRDDSVLSCLLAIYEDLDGTINWNLIHPGVCVQNPVAIQFYCRVRVRVAQNG